MDSEKQRAGQLFSEVLSTFRRKQHRDTFEVMMNLFLTGQGQPLPHLATVKSPSAVSRFLNQYDWDRAQHREGQGGPQQRAAPGKGSQGNGPDQQSGT